MRRYFALFLSFILIFNFVSFSYADTIDSLIRVDPDVSGISSSSNTGNDSVENIDELTVKDSNSSWGILSFLLDNLTALLSTITEPLFLLVYIFPTIDGLIFNRQNYFKISIFDTNPVGFSAALQGYISAIYNAFRYLVVAIYIVVLVYLAIRMMFSAIGRQKARYKELFKHWLVGLLLLFSFHWVMAFVIWLSNTFVQIIADYSSNLVTDITVGKEISVLANSPLIYKYPITTFIVTRISGIGAEMTVPTATIVIIKAIISLLALIFLLYQTWSITMTYLKRLFTICILVLLFPLVALSYVFDKIGDRRAQTFEIWLKEFITNIAIQPIHALILLFIAIIFSSSENSATALLLGRNTLGGIMTFALLRLIPVGEELLKKLFQISSNMGPGSHGIAGSMAHAGMAVNSAKNMIGNVAKKAAGLKDVHNHNKLKKNLLESASNVKNSSERKAAYENASNMINADKERLLAKYGSKSLGGIQAKSAASLMAAMGGVATAVTGSGTGRFAADALSRADAYSSAVSTVTTDLPKSIKEFRDGDAKKAEGLGLTELLDKLNNPAKMTKDDMKKLTVLLDLDRSTVENAFKNPKDEKNKNAINQWQHSVNEMALKAKWGEGNLTFEDIKKQNYTAKRAESIRNGIDPDTGKPIDFDNFTFSKTKTGTLLKNEKTGEEIIFNTNGDSSIPDGERRVLDPKLKGTSVKDNLRILETIEHDAEKAVEDTKNARKKARDKLDRLDESSPEYQTAKAEFDITDAKYDEAVARHKKAKKDLSIAEKEAEKLLSFDVETVENGAKPIFAETALGIVQADPSKGVIRTTENNMKIIMADGSQYSMENSTPSPFKQAMSEYYSAEETFNISHTTFEAAEQNYRQHPDDTQARKTFEKSKAEYDVATERYNTAYDKVNHAYTSAPSPISTDSLSYLESQRTTLIEDLSDAKFDMTPEDYTVKEKVLQPKIDRLNNEISLVNDLIDAQKVASLAQDTFELSPTPENLSSLREARSKVTTIQENLDNYNEMYHSDVTISPDVIESVQQAIRTEVFNSNPGLKEKISRLNTEYATALQLTDDSQREQYVEQISAELVAANLEYSEQYTAKVQQYTSNPNSTPFNSSVDMTAIFSTISSINNSANSSKSNASFNLGNVPEATEQFSYGVCPELSKYLDDYSDKPTIIKLFYRDDHTLSVKAANERDETIITVTSEVINNIFGGDYLPVTLYSRSGAWYRQ